MQIKYNLLNELRTKVDILLMHPNQTSYKKYYELVNVIESDPYCYPKKIDISFREAKSDLSKQHASLDKITNIAKIIQEMIDYEILKIKSYNQSQDSANGWIDKFMSDFVGEEVK
jgi:hypothetical protein